MYNPSFPRNIRLIPGCCEEIKTRSYWRKQEVSCVYQDPVDYTNLYQIRVTIKISHLTVKTTAPAEWWVLAWLILQVGAVARTMDFNL